MRLAYFQILGLGLTRKRRDLPRLFLLVQRFTDLIFYAPEISMERHGG
jgi:hypothetical protein